MRSTRLLTVVALVVVARAGWPQGNPVGPEFRVNTWTTYLQARPSVAADPAGNFVVVWESEPHDSVKEVFAQRFGDTGTPVGQEFRVNTYVPGNHNLTSVAVDPTGNFTVVWTMLDGLSNGVFGRRYGSSGVPLGNEFRVNTYTASSQFGPAVAADSSGNFVVVWASSFQDGSFSGIYGQRYESSGIPLGNEFRVNTSTTNYQVNPTVAMDSAGNFVVVWWSRYPIPPGTGFGVSGQRFASSGVPLGPEFRVNTSTGNLRYSVVGADSMGDFVVVWHNDGQDGSGLGVFCQRFASSGMPLGSEFRVNTYTTGSQGYSAVAVDASGNFVVAWQGSSQDGSSYGVFGQRFANSGSPLGPEFRVNDFTPSYQGRPRIAADAAGNFVVVWQSQGQDGSNYGVFGQRFNMIVPVELMNFRVE
jgi:hypothetical protein